MSERGLFAAILAAVCLFAGLAVAQDEKNEVSAVVGRTFLSKQAIQGASFFDPFIRFGDGLSFEGGYSRRVILRQIYSVSGEVMALYNPDEDLHSGGPGLVPKDYSALFVTPGVRVNLFPTTSVSPWGSVGGGFGHITQNGVTIYGAPNTGKATTSGVMQFGFGLDVKLKTHLLIRGEARDYWAGEPDFPAASTGKTRQHNFFAGGGVIWRF